MSQPSNKPSSVKVLSEVQVEEKFQLVQSLIERYDTLGIASANRAAIILSANGFLLAATTLLLGQVLPLISLTDLTVEQIAVAILMASTVMLQTISAISAILALGYIGRGSRKLLDIKQAERLFFHGGSTYREFFKANRKPKDNFDDFKIKFLEQNKSEMLNYALAELWNVIRVDRFQYYRSRRSARLLLGGLITLILTIVVVLF